MELNAMELNDLLESTYKLFSNMGLSEEKIFLYLVLTTFVYIIGCNMAKLSLSFIFATFMILISTTVEIIIDKIKRIPVEIILALLRILPADLIESIRKKIPYDISEQIFTKKTSELSVKTKILFLIGGCYFISVMIVEFVPFVIYFFLLYACLQVYQRLDYIFVLTAIVAFFLLKIFLKHIKRGLFTIIFSIISAVQLCFALQYIADHSIVPNFIAMNKDILATYLMCLENIKHKNIACDTNFITFAVGASFHFQRSFKF